MEIAAPMLEDTVVVDPKTGETRTEKYRTSKVIYDTAAHFVLSILI